MENIILIGFMGCGKSTMGKAISSRLGIEFMDTDELIEKQESKSISDIFKTQGEIYFRKLEEDLIKQLSPKRAVISVGGGLPCFNNNIEVLKRLGTTFYINPSINELFSRLRKDDGSRPLLKNMNDDELKSFIGEKLNEREKYYLAADHVVSSLEEVLELLN